MKKLKILGLFIIIISTCSEDIISTKDSIYPWVSVLIFRVLPRKLMGVIIQNLQVQELNLTLKLEGQ